MCGTSFRVVWHMMLALSAHGRNRWYSRSVRLIILLAMFFVRCVFPLPNFSWIIVSYDMGWYFWSVGWIIPLARYLVRCVSSFAQRFVNNSISWYCIFLLWGWYFAFKSIILLYQWSATCAFICLCIRCACFRHPYTWCYKHTHNCAIKFA